MDPEPRTRALVGTTRIGGLPLIHCLEGACTTGFEMKVFISWSGHRCGQVASALRDWLPGVLQVIEPWLSSEDLPLGARWADEIARALQSTDVGIICLTPENLQSPWLMYEAGALSKRVSESLVCTYALDIPPTEISGPLAQFQSTIAQREDMLGDTASSLG